MRNSSRLILLLCILNGLFLSCTHKEGKINPVDQVLELRLMETGSGDPAANVVVVVADVDTFTNTGPDFTYFNDYAYTIEDTLGATDAAGELTYRFPAEFPLQNKVLFTVENDQFWSRKIGLTDFHSGAQLQASLFPYGYVKVKVNHLEATTDPADIFALMQTDETYPWRKNYVTPYVTALLGESAELTAKVHGNADNLVFVEQHHNFLSTAYTIKALDPVFVPARDTVFAEINF